MKKHLFVTSFILASFAAIQGFTADNEYKIQLKDHKFNPNIIEVPANTKFKLIIDNQDETAAEFESHDLNKEKIITGKKTGTIIITPLKAGTYNFFDDFHQKEAIGKIIAK